MRRLRLLAILLGTCAAGVFGLSQLQQIAGYPRGPQQTPAATTPGETVRIFISVRDKNGRAVRDLTPQDVQILEKGQPLKIEKLELAPLAIGLLFDASASRRGAMPGAENEPAAALLVEFMHDQNVGFVVAFNDKPTVLAPPTKDLAKLGAAVRTATSSFRGASAVYDTLQFSADRFLIVESAANVLVVISDFEDNASKSSIDRAIETLQRTITRAYVVLIKPPDRQGRIWRLLSGRAKRLTESTGGLSFPVAKPQDVSAAFRKIGEDLRGLYSVEFRPAAAASGDRLHNIRIGTLRRDLLVSAPDGYFSLKN